MTAVSEEQRAREASQRLDVQLDAPLPSELAVERGTALFVAGWCFCREARIRALSLVVDGDHQPVMEHGMPRLDVMRALHPGVDPYDTAGIQSDPGSEEDPNLLSYRSGFWGMARLVPREGNAPYELKLHAELEGGGRVTADLGTIGVGELEAPVVVDEPEPGTGPLVAICMATYEPPLDLFRRQMESIRAQTHRNWVCVISDDCSSAEAFA
ncbi:MAG: hypothetical protein ACJ76V_08940, partial [Thermoleophilaceae bacterium]